MRKLLLVLLTGCATTTATPSSRLVIEPSAGQIPPGTTVWAKLDGRVSLSEDRVGSPISARLSESVVSPTGEVLIPAGAILGGQITDLTPGYGDQPAMVRLELDTINFAGVTQPIRAEIVETQNASWVHRVRGRDVGIGAAGGALVGAILGGGKGAIAGGLLGAAGGTAISLGTNDAEENIPEGTGIAVRLDAPVQSLASLRNSRYY